MAVAVFKIDGRDVSAALGSTILEVAREEGIHIPTLCALPGLSDIDACRMCLVEIAGSTRLAAACVTKIAEGMEILTETPRLREYRRINIELLLAERNHVCSVCVSNGHCDLQWHAQQLGVDHVRFPYIYPQLPVDASHARFLVDHNRCILCTRCVRVCDEVEGAHTWDVMGRGTSAQVITDLAQPWGDSASCTGCAKCVHVCPTGALVEKGRAVAEMEKRRGFLPYLSLMREQKKRRQGEQTL